MTTTRSLLNALLIAPVITTGVFVGSNASASEISADASDVPESSGMSRVVPVAQLEQPDASDGNALSQVTSVSQLSDVQPTDWAFQALQSLVERYGCIAGYPNRTYRGNRAMTRYEFAAGLNACMDRVNELIASATADAVKKEDLEALKKMQEQFATELATLRGQVDGLEARAKTLEAQQFSTTTKLNGEVIFALSGAIGGDRAVPNGNPNPNNDVEENTVFQHRTRLNLDTSFTGKDRLRTRLQALNSTAFTGAITGTNSTRLSVDGTTNNNLVVQRLEYRFPVGKKATIYVEANAGEFNDNMETFSPLESSARGSISRFGRFNPIYRLGPGSASGITFNYKVLDGERQKVTLSGGYLANNAQTPASGVGNGGLFSGGYAAIAQLAYEPLKNFKAGFTYVRLYSDNGAGITASTGSAWANSPFGTVPTVANAFGLQMSWRVLPKFNISGWGGYTQAYATRTQGTVQDNDKANIINWSVAFSFPDVIRKGDLAAVVVGQPPYISSNDFAGRRNAINSADTWHIEALYRYTINDNIDITPGVLYVLNPESNGSNDNILVGTIRTTFRF
jgi:hypothetical protein